MCTLCEVYGTEKIEDEARLKEVLDLIGKDMIHDDEHLSHSLKMIDIWMDGGDRWTDPDVEETWERTIHKN